MYDHKVNDPEQKQRTSQEAERREDCISLVARMGVPRTCAGWGQSGASPPEALGSEYCRASSRCPRHCTSTLHRIISRLPRRPQKSFHPRSPQHASQPPPIPPHPAFATRLGAPNPAPPAQLRSRPVGRGAHAQRRAARAAWGLRRRGLLRRPGRGRAARAPPPCRSAWAWLWCRAW